MISIQPALSRSKVLVVDDGQAILALLLRILSGAGYKVSTAQDGAKALQIALAQSFDLLLTDLVMPDQDGIELIVSIRKQQPNLKIIAISGAFGGSILPAGKLLGSHATLPKPCSPSHLLAVIHEALQS